MNFDVHNIRVHDHDWRRDRVVDHDALDGRTIIEECRFDDCDAWRSRWDEEPEQTTLGDIGGGVDD
jgi:hypothetical protein